MSKVFLPLIFSAVLILPACAQTMAQSQDRDEEEVEVVTQPYERSYEYSYGDEDDNEKRREVRIRRGGAPNIIIDRDSSRDFDDLDTDGDGRLSRAEADAAEIEHFEEWDRNDDGYVEEPEIEAWADEIVARVEEELAVEMAELDREMAELDREMQALGPEIERAIRMGQRMRGRFAGMPGNVDIRIPPVFAMGQGMGFSEDTDGLDIDGDGTITEEEFLEARREVFDRLDDDGDGVISEDELEGYQVWYFDSDKDDGAMLRRKRND